MPTSRSLLSVALCTFNGERFLGEQLASIGRQTRLPDELIICDDGSDDRTEQIVEAFARTVHFPVTFTVNERTLGSTKNFEQAISRCRGDLIALCDQDDVWNEGRLQRSEEELIRHPKALLAFSDGDIIDEEGRRTGKTLWESFGFGTASKASIHSGNYDLYVKDRFVTGATVMVRRTLLEHLVPAGPEWFHDEWIVALCPLFGDILPIEEPLIRYRRHSSQQIGPSVPIRRGAALQFGWGLMTDAALADSHHWSRMRRRKAATDQLCEVTASLALESRNQSAMRAYGDYQAYMAVRLSLPEQRFRRLGLIAKHMKWYLRFGGWKSVVKDLLLIGPNAHAA